MIYLFPSFFLTLINNNWARVCELNVCAHGVLTITKKCSVETQMRESIPEPLSQGKMVWKQGRWGWSLEKLWLYPCVLHYIQKTDTLKCNFLASMMQFKSTHRTNVWCGNGRLRAIWNIFSFLTSFFFTLLLSCYLFLPKENKIVSP